MMNNKRRRASLIPSELPKGFAELNPKPNQEIEVKIVSAWNPCDFMGVNRWGHAVVVLHDKSVLTLNCFHEVRAVSGVSDD